jgi:phosphonate transport system substrate-binding protein
MAVARSPNRSSVSAHLLLSLLLAAAGGARAQEAFQLGVAPHTSARVIVEMYQPLRAFLEKELGQSVEVVTAPDFTEFARRALRQEYDLAITTGHQARLLETDAHYAPLLTYQADFKAVALVAKEGKIKTPKDAAGSNVVGLSSTSLVTLWGQHWLQRSGLGGTPIRYVSAADSVAQLILNGDATVGFVSLANFQKLPPDVQAKLSFLASSDSMAGRVYLLNQRREKLRAKLDAALWTFASTPEAKVYFEKNALQGYRKLKPKELEQMDPYAAEVRRVLAEPR